MNPRTHHYYTIAVGDQMALAKAKAFVARYGEDIESILRASSPNRVLHVQVYSAEQLEQHYRQRTADDYRIMAAHISDIHGGGTQSISVVVEWDTEDVIIVSGSSEMLVPS